jgi:hypothetical protein
MIAVPHGIGFQCFLNWYLALLNTALFMNSLEYDIQHWHVLFSMTKHSCFLHTSLCRIAEKHNCSLHSFALHKKLLFSTLLLFRNAQKHSCSLQSSLFRIAQKHSCSLHSLLFRIAQNTLVLYTLRLVLCTLYYSALHKTLLFSTLFVLFSALFVIPHCTKILLFCTLCYYALHKNTLVLCTLRNWYSALHNSTLFICTFQNYNIRQCRLPALSRIETVYCKVYMHLVSFLYEKKIMSGTYLIRPFLHQVERTLRVRGDLHIGGVMIHLVDSLGKSVPNQTSFSSTSDQICHFPPPGNSR